MALYDNRHWLLTHIRNSFISSDDTGMCEVLVIDDFPNDSVIFSELDKFPSAEVSSEEEDNQDHSPEIHTDSEFGRPRLRTNTAQRLAKMEQDMKKAALVKHVQWEPPGASTDDFKLEIFEKKTVRTAKGPFRSLLSLQLEKCPNLPRNPFVEYAKFGGNSQSGIPTRTYKVFMTMVALPDRNYPLTVCVLGSAKVFELIGYVCWKYTSENTDPNFQFKEDITNYGLYIAEDDGEVDWDFSCLDSKETVGKFGLAYLALVEIPDKHKTAENSGDDTASNAPGPIRPLTDTGAEDGSWEQIYGDLNAIEALLYQSFPVQIMSKMRTRTEVNLGISGDKMEVDPVVTNTKVGGKMWRHKSASYDMDDIVFCDMIETKTSGRAVFRVVRRAVAMEEVGSFPRSAASCPVTTSFKNHDFEGEQKIVEEVVRKVNLILHLKCSIYRREYLTLRDKKPRRRKSFSIWPR